MPTRTGSRLKVFISSSVADLREHRQTVQAACYAMGLDVVMFDTLPASPESAVQVLQNGIDEADIYIGIVGTRYGGVPQGYDISFTEIEYNHASERQMPRLIFLMGDSHPVRQQYIDVGEAREKLEAFRRRLLDRHVVGFFNSPEELHAQVIKALKELLAKLGQGTPGAGSTKKAATKKAGPGVKKAAKKAAKPPASRRASAEPVAGGGGPAEPAFSLRRRGVAENARDAKAASDQPVTDKKKDRIGFGVYAEALSAFIASPDTTTPLTIGIDAPWGQGKTSLMRMIQNELNGRESRAVRLKRWAELQRWRASWVAASLVWYAGKAIAWGGERGGRELIPAFDVLKVSQAAAAKDGGREADAGEEPSDLGRLFRWCAAARRPRKARHPTVWFNAWKFDQEEAIWSAMASAILEQIKADRSWPGRLAIWLRLQFKRANRMRVLKDVAGKIFWPVLLAGVWLLWERYHEAVTAELRLSVSERVEDAITWALGLGTLLTSGVKIASIIEDPFSLPLSEYVDAPDYRAKVGFIGEFEQDFRRIVEVATRRVWGWEPRKLVVFIDDLDRCEPPKSADVIEAVNIFLDSPGCVFVIGMDSRAIVASIETKYDEMFKRVQSESPDQPTLGRYFLEKIIQVPFTIPPIPDHSISRLVADVIGPRPRARAGDGAGAGASGQGGGGPDPQGGTAADTGGGSGAPTPDAQGPRVDVGSYENLDVWDSINSGVRFLASNPRQLKRFINSFRLQLYIADARDLFRELVSDKRGPKGYTLECLAAWTALCMRWPQIATCLSLEGQRDEFRRWLAGLAQSLDRDGRWVANFYNDAVKGLKPESVALIKTHVKRRNVTLRQALLLASTPAQTAANGNAGREQVGAPGLHWRTLPWDRWLDQSDFLQVIKALEDWWEMPGEAQKDWLTMALLTSE